MANIKETLQERGTRYGEFIDNATIAQKIKSIYRESPNWGSMPSDQQEALDQIASKISRHLVGDFMYDDGFRDIAGYATLAVERLEKLSNKVTEPILHQGTVDKNGYKTFSITRDFNDSLDSVVGEISLSEEACELIESTSSRFTLSPAFLDSEYERELVGISLCGVYGPVS